VTNRPTELLDRPGARVIGISPGADRIMTVASSWAGVSNDEEEGKECAKDMPDKAVLRGNGWMFEGGAFKAEGKGHGLDPKRRWSPGGMEVRRSVWECLKVAGRDRSQNPPGHYGQGGAATRLASQSGGPSKAGASALAGTRQHDPCLAGWLLKCSPSTVLEPSSRQHMGHLVLSVFPVAGCCSTWSPTGHGDR
jgi:hypothetical protein